MASVIETNFRCFVPIVLVSTVIKVTGQAGILPERVTILKNESYPKNKLTPIEVSSVALFLDPTY
jgi:hypothetical protein